MIREAPGQPSKEELIAPIAAQAAGIAAPTARIADLERRLGLNGSNSLKSPSCDGLKKPARVSHTNVPVRSRAGKKVSKSGFDMTATAA
ncbi:MAG: hypothetical protein CR217_13395 [Beijerinckiaceae bacterium]|nr:MAG: hypothetical protein CR217_13395 [Beijerinckiaceae bacterium]